MIIFVGNAVKYTHVLNWVSVKIDHTDFHLIASALCTQIPVLYPSSFFTWINEMYNT